MGLALALAAAPAAAGPRPADPALARLAPALRDAVALQEQGSIDRFRLRRPAPEAADGMSVVVEPLRGAAGRQPQHRPFVDAEVARALADTLRRAGFIVEAVAPHGVQVRVPWSRLRALASVPGVRRVREPRRATAKEVRTEGVTAIGADAWQVAGLDGSGVVVGVLDVGFEVLDGALGSELPAVVGQQFGRGDVESTAHGTAVAEVIHDVAPGADLVLATFGTDVELAEVIDGLIDAGAQVINASIGFDNAWHADGTSAVTQLADAAVARGIVWVAAAGNEDERYRVADLGAPGAEGFVPLGGEPVAWAWAPNGYAQVSFRWSEPFGTAATDLDLYLYNDDGTLCGSSADTQDGEGDPFEEVVASGCSDWVQATVFHAGTGDPAGLTGYLYGNHGLESAGLTHTQSLTLPGDLVDGISVGAWRPEDDSIASYSSRGPTNDGRTKPDVVGPTGVSTLSYGPQAFEGSSAAAPHVAGLAALLVQANGGEVDPLDVRDTLIAGARDLGAPGMDDVFGAGAVRAGPVPQVKVPAGCACGTTGGAPGPSAAAWALGVIASAWKVRRQGRA